MSSVHFFHAALSFALSGLLIAFMAFAKNSLLRLSIRLGSAARNDSF